MELADVPDLNGESVAHLTAGSVQFSLDNRHALPRYGLTDVSKEIGAILAIDADLYGEGRLLFRIPIDVYQAVASFRKV